jgi:hypothetical protein
MKRVFYYQDRQGEWLLFDPESTDDMEIAALILNYLKTLQVYEVDEAEPYLESGHDSFKKMELLVEEWDNLLANQEILGVEFVEYPLEEE